MGQPILAAAGFQPANYRNKPPKRRLQAELPAPQGVFITVAGLLKKPKAPVAHSSRLGKTRTRYNELRRRVIVKVCVLASSSSGNSAFIRTERTRILVDAGLSKRDLFARLTAIGEQCETLDAILITHEHSDHVSGLVSLARHLNAPIFITRLTAPAIPWGEYTPKLDCFQAGTTFTIGDIEVNILPSRTMPLIRWDSASAHTESRSASLQIRIFAGFHQVPFARHGSSRSGIESRSRNAESWAISMVGEAARDGTQGSFVERRGFGFHPHRSGFHHQHAGAGTFERAQ